MLDLADVGPGSRVLDVGAGAGERSLIAAERAGPDGLVLATDIFAAMLALLSETARELGVATIRTEVVDGRDLDLEPDSFDASILRNALMLMADRNRVLERIRRGLKPGGKFAANVFSAKQRNDAVVLLSALPRFSEQAAFRVAG
jgi:ubiquinone/menaquinone biosynthesis C-methylase UbiE